MKVESSLNVAPQAMASQRFSQILWYRLLHRLFGVPILLSLDGLELLLKARVILREPLTSYLDISYEGVQLAEKPDGLGFGLVLLVREVLLHLVLHGDKAVTLED
jgi:hypothetical protein